MHVVCHKNLDRTGWRNYSDADVELVLEAGGDRKQLFDQALQILQQMGSLDESCGLQGGWVDGQPKKQDKV